MSMALKVAKARAGAPSGGAFIPRSQFIGDPGFFGFLGKAIGTVTKIAGGLIGIGPQPQQPILRFQETPSRLPALVPEPGPVARIERLVPGGATGLEPGVRPAGFHLNRSSYFLKDGTFIEKGTVFVKDRRRNDLNPRALTRAINRVKGAKGKESVLKLITIKCKSCGKQAGHAGSCG